MSQTIFRICKLSFCIMFFLNSGFGQSKEDLLKTERLRFKAMEEKDSVSLKKILDEELAYTHSSGQKDGQQSFIASIASGQLEYQKIEIEQLDARTEGNLGWISGKLRVTVKIGTADPVNLHLSYLDIYHFQKKQWRMVAWQSARLPD